MSKKIFWGLAGWLVMGQSAVTAAAIVNLSFFGTFWEDRLNEATTSAGVPNFNALERQQIQDEVQAQIERQYAAFDSITFGQNIGGATDSIGFHQSAGPGTLGQATFRSFNVGAPPVIDVFPGNFDFFLEPGDPRATQIREISTALAGTAGHELGHSFGLHHSYAYGADGITPANYANTGGLQNQHIMATGSTGLSESEREVERTFSTLSNLVLDGAGGFFGGGDTLNSVHLSVDNYFNDFTNATVGTASPVVLQTAPASGLDAGFLGSNIVSGGGDLDVFSFNANGPGTLYALALSSIYSNGIDTLIRLLDVDGTTVLASNDNTLYNGDLYGAGILQTTDSAFVNVPLPAAGTYYLEVSSLGNVGSNAAALNRNYGLLFGLDTAATVPEPASVITFGLLLIMGCFKVRQVRARNKAC